jgi:hypothetical protein
MIPESKAGVTEDEFANLRPKKVTTETVILRDCPVLDDRTGEEVTKTSMVHDVTVEPVQSTATATQFKFRSFVGDEHRGYEEDIIPTTTTVTSKDEMNKVDEVWWYPFCDACPKPFPAGLVAITNASSASDSAFDTATVAVADV